MPIKSIRSWVLWSSLIISTFLFVFSQPFRANLENWLTHDINIPTNGVNVAIFIVALIFLRGTGWISEAIPKYLRPLRRIMMGNRFIEGTWLDAVFDAHDDKHDVKHVGIINFKYDNGYLIVTADDYEPNGAWRSGFNSIFGDMCERSIYRYCWARNIVRTNTIDHGYAEYAFRVPRGRPTEFTGNCTSVTRGTENHIEGDKLTKDLLRALSMSPRKDYLSHQDDRTTLIENYSKYKAHKKRKRSVVAQ